MNKDELKEIRLSVKEQFGKIIGEERDFPKYTTPIINIANQNAQATRPNVVGKMSELIQDCPKQTYEGWREWYLERHPDAIDIATDKIMDMLKEMKKAFDMIDREMVREWVEDLVIDKTAEGLIIQEIILKKLADKKDVDYRLATPQGESKNIDGFLGSTPISI